MRTRPLVFPALAALLFVAGAALRLHDATRPLLAGDELHAVRMATTRDYAGYFTEREFSHASLPLVLYARVLMDTVGLTELRLRLPSLAASLLLLLLPLLLRRALGDGATLAAMALLATSPLPVYYALVARPYAPAAFCVLLALCCWHRWVVLQRRAARWVFAAAGLLAALLHLFAVVAVGTLLALALLDRRARRGAVQAAAVVLLGLAAVTAPSLPDFLQSHAGKLAAEPRELALLQAALLVVAGGSWSYALPLLALATAGAARALATRDRLLGAALALFLVQLVALLAAAPLGGPMAWARYLDLVSPALLLLAGAGAAGLVRALGAGLARPHAAPLASLALAGLVAVLAPLTTVMAIYSSSPGSFRAIALDLLVDDPLPPPAVYAAVLADPDPGRVLVEAPVPPDPIGWKTSRAMQQLHGLPVKLALDGVAGLREQGVHLRHVLDLSDLDELRDSGARYLVTRNAALQPEERQLLAQHFGHPLVRADGQSLYELLPARP